MSKGSAGDSRKQREATMRELVGATNYDRNKDMLEQADAVQEAASFIRQMRECSKLSQAVLGLKIGVSQERISEIERGGSPEGVSYALLRRVARACGFSDWPSAPTEVPVDIEEESVFYNLKDNSFEIIPERSVQVSRKKLNFAELFTVKETHPVHRAKTGGAVNGMKVTLNSKFGNASIRVVPRSKGRKYAASPAQDQVLRSTKG